LLKAGVVEVPEQAASVLARDVEIIVRPERATDEDLWPAIWALATVLERQFSGMVYIRAGLSGPLRQPSRLGSRCRFGTAPAERGSIQICLGGGQESDALRGDARGASISFGTVLESSGPANPLSCFALAGYLGFAALASAARIPGYREQFAVQQISLPFQQTRISDFPSQRIDFVGLGHLGQAYLALLFFLLPHLSHGPRIQLIDKGSFEDPNWATQILIDKQDLWIGAEKAEYLKQRARSWGLEAESEVKEINWGWRPQRPESGVVILGLDRFEPRRMAIAAGYSWVIDAGLGDSFLRPRISYHSFAANNQIARRIFPDDEAPVVPTKPGTPFLKRLQNKNGGCGLLTYESTQASAPSMGLVASALTWSEALLYLSGVQEQVRGAATIWSPILPYLRDKVESSLGSNSDVAEEMKLH
jgi:hypothetical protein